MITTNTRKLKIKQLIVSRLNLKHDPETIGDNVLLFEAEEDNGLGLDSVDALELAVTINSEFDVTITDDDMEIFDTVDSIDKFIEQQS